MVKRFENGLVECVLDAGLEEPKELELVAGVSGARQPGEVGESFAGVGDDGAEEVEV